MNIQCAGCGGILQSGVAFCNYCGRPRGETPALDSPEVLAIIPQVQYCKGFLGLGSTMNILVITREHLLIAETPKTMEALISAMDDELVEFCSQSGLEPHEFIKTRDFSQAPWQVYARRPLRECKEDHPHNRILELRFIQKVELGMFDGWNDDTLNLYLPEETLKFILWWPLGEIAMEAFQKVLGDRVKDVS